MCGLVGLFDGRAKRDFDRGLLVRMADSIAHRGPDADGFFQAPGIALAHRRLAIIDLSSGQQPMYSADGKAVIVFNGEIYNFGELTTELKGLGQIFRTHSDTEVILNAWRAWGPACVARFSGMFAFALWDMEQETLFIARDHLGKKPLYYAIAADRRMAFASELKAMLQCPWVPRRISAEAVEDYFALGYVPDPKSIYRDVHKLPPAHALLWRKGAAAPTITSYWDLDLGQTHKLSATDAAEELSHRFKKAVTRRLMAEVPLGAFLSGGVDSSGVVAHMATASSQPVKTCTIGFGEGSHDERQYARAMAERYHTQHAEKVLDPDFTVRSPDLLDRVAAAYDEPFADSSAIPTYQVCAAARESVTVALSGDGGDEALGGYRRYRWHMHEHAMRRAIPGAIRGPLFGFLGSVYPHMAWAPRFLRARATFRELAMDASTAYLNNVATVRDDLRGELFAQPFTSDLQSYRAVDGIAALMAKAPGDDPLLQAQYIDSKTWLAGRMLVKVDRASMAHGLEVRSPLLDYELFQWAVSLPARLKIDGNEGKAVLKRSLEPLVPHELLYRPKQGFGMPIAAWLRGNLRSVITRAIASPVLLDAGYFKPDVLRRLVSEHTAGQRDHSAALWSILMFERFLAREARQPAFQEREWQADLREAVPAE